jgi:hypothetical protein
MLVWKNSRMLRKVTILAFAVLAGVSGVLWMLGLTDWVSFQVSGTVWFDGYNVCLGNVSATDRSLEVDSRIPGTFWPEIVLGTEFGIALVPQSDVGYTSIACRVPWWVLLLLFGVYPTVQFVRKKRQEYQKTRRLEHGQCNACGYDLTGNTSGVCPECGCATRTDTGPQGPKQDANLAAQSNPDEPDTAEYPSQGPGDAG